MQQTNDSEKSATQIASNEEDVINYSFFDLRFFICNLLITNIYKIKTKQKRRNHLKDQKAVKLVIVLLF